MDDVLLVQMVQCSGNVREAASKETGGKGGGSGDFVEHVTCGGVVHDEGEGGGSVRDMGEGDCMEGHYVGVLLREVVGDLAADSGADLGSRDELDGDVLGGWGAAGEVDCAGGALT